MGEVRARRPYVSTRRGRANDTHHTTPAPAAAPTAAPFEPTVLDEHGDTPVPTAVPAAKVDAQPDGSQTLAGRDVIDAEPRFEPVNFDTEDTPAGDNDETTEFAVEADEESDIALLPDAVDGDSTERIDDTSTEPVDYSTLTVAQLREILAGRGLTVRGTKTELIARLEADDSE